MATNLTGKNCCWRNKMRLPVAKSANIFCILLLAVLFFPVAGQCIHNSPISDEEFFTLENGLNLRDFGGSEVRNLLIRQHGQGVRFGKTEQKIYQRLKKDEQQIQWTLSDLQSGEVLSRSENADEVFFGASASKIFVAATLLNKQHGKLRKDQLRLMTRMIVRSNNQAWKELQRQAGVDGTDDSGREAVDRFAREMGYNNLRCFQGWLKKKDGTKIHGNELNCTDVDKFLYDTYHRKYEGAEILWKIMHATRTGKKKINKYTPKDIYIAGKTGTYQGPNESPETIQLKTLKARNHVVMLNVNGRYYGLSIFCNTGRNEDVAILGGGLMREFLDVNKLVSK